jgi:hypothetical protein
MADTTPAGWYTAGDAEAQQRIRAAWKEAPIENSELLEFVLDVARDQVLEFAPDGEPADVIRRLLEGYGFDAAKVDAVLVLLDLDTAEIPVPARYIYAQLQQAKNLWNAGRVDSAGDVGPEGFSFTPRPLDKTVQSIIRPRSGAASVF